MSGRMLLGFVLGFIIAFLVIAFWPSAATDGAEPTEKIMRALGRDTAPGLARKANDGLDYSVLAMNFGISVVAGLFTGGIMRMLGR